MTAPGPRTRALLERAGTLTAALERARDRLPASASEPARTVLAAVRERLALGVDHTVVALVGGTGSGKSSVFNALTGLDFADVGVRRPTTSQVTACVWAHDASGLLDWLGVADDRRIERESALDGETQADLRGLVLLDLPDHDSVEPEHRAVVDRLLPLVDLLVWVVDPQKYADDALHTGYLRHLVGHEASMLVILNQVDTVPATSREPLLADVRRLLAEDGLDDVGTLALSARTGEGVRDLRARLADAVTARGVAELRAAAELGDAARALAAGVGAGEPEPPVDRTVATLAEASGVPAAVATVARAAGRCAPVPDLGPAQAQSVALTRAAWLDDVGSALPRGWADAVEREVADEATLARALDDRLAAVTPAPPRTAGVRGLGLVAGVIGLLAVVAGAVTLVQEPAGGRTSAAVLACAGALALAVVLVVASRALHRRARRRAAGRLEAGARAAVQEVVERHLAAPTRAVLADHRALREAVATPTDTVPEGPARRHGAHARGESGASTP